MRDEIRSKRVAMLVSKGVAAGFCSGGTGKELQTTIIHVSGSGDKEGIRLVRWAVEI